MNAQEPGGELDERRLANVRTGYEVAKNLWVDTDQLLWSKFNALLVANSILLGAVAFFLSGSKPSLIIPVMASFAGFLVTVLWWLMVQRNSELRDYYVASARELECWLPPVETVNRGRLFARGAQVNVNGGPMFLGLAARVLTIGRAARLVILIFLLLHLSLLGYAFAMGSAGRLPWLPTLVE